MAGKTDALLVKKKNDVSLYLSLRWNRRLNRGSYREVYCMPSCVQAKPPRSIPASLKHRQEIQYTIANIVLLLHREGYSEIDFKLATNLTVTPQPCHQWGYDSLCRNRRYALSSSSESIDDHSIFEVLG